MPTEKPLTFSEAVRALEIDTEGGGALLLDLLGNDAKTTAKIRKILKKWPDYVPILRRPPPGHVLCKTSPGYRRPVDPSKIEAAYSGSAHRRPIFPGRETRGVHA